ncbi:histidine phosphatase family protein [Holdemania massiliensis]|uniref:histidine phosphatase family protein n=1 Tax=Holdemania massiliensis TaxID=1468449 RepID=UPI001F05B4F6|nr:histidine phosphatase family protein [Holdemania massiliensis]MCH1939400.1 histidine phosphatase family protein [Holdemania massiliensis]
MKSVKKLIMVICLILSCTACAQPEGPSSSSDVQPVMLYFVRHGKTMFNTTGQIQGWSDTPLTEAGETQADATGRGLKDISFIAAYTSDLGRARATAQRILAQNEQPVPQLIELTGLREWGYGGYEGRPGNEMWDPIFEAHGLTFDESFSQYKELKNLIGEAGIADAIAANDPTQTAETYDQILTRAQQAMDQIVAEAQAAGGGSVLIVSSGGVIPTILKMLMPDQFQGGSLANCSVTIVEVQDGQYTLGVVGDTSYTEKGTVKQ